MVEPSVFRDVLAQWPSGVTIVTTLDDTGAWHGMTASSFSSVSLAPPLVSVCLARGLRSHELISTSGVFGVSVLAKDQAEVARRFAGMVPDCHDRFAGETWSTGETGVGLLDSALGWLDCRVVHEHDGGDHTIFVGEVVSGHTARRSAPLLFHSRGWGQFADAMPDVATLSDTGAVAELRGNSADHTAYVVRELIAAGLRVRVDEDTDLPSEGGGTSMLVSDSAQARRALDRGVSVVELVVDPTSVGDLDAVCQHIEGIAEHSSVQVIQAFDPHHADVVLRAIETLAGAGVLEIHLPDPHGESTPLEVRALLQEAVALARPTPIRVGLHNRDGLGLVKALIALKSGVSHFDTTVSGSGDRVATAHLVRLLEEVDVATPIDTSVLAALVATTSPATSVGAPA